MYNVCHPSLSTFFFMYSLIQVFKMKLVVNRIFVKDCTRNDYVFVGKAKCVIEFFSKSTFVYRNILRSVKQSLYQCMTDIELLMISKMESQVCLQQWKFMMKVLSPERWV